MTTTRPEPRHDSGDPLPAIVARVLSVRLLARLALPGLGALALALTAPVATADQFEAPSAAPTAGETSGSPAAEAQGAPPATPTTTTTETAPGGQPVGAQTQTTARPEVQAQSPQAQSAPRAHRRTHGHTTGSGGAGAAAPSPSVKLPLADRRSVAPLPSALTPALPSALGAPISGIPNFFIESFRVPPFLLPVYQAAGTAYGIPWQVLAAINEVETDYGRDLNISSAGAEGWMQFLPSSWTQYGVDANGDGYEDPYNPADAIFAAARYLAAAGGAADIRAAVFSYNHSQAYVDSVILRSQLLGGTPPELLSAITGLTESRFPVHALSHFADGFPVVSESRPSGSSIPSTLAGTTIYSQDRAPVIAVQDGRITAIGDSPTLGRYISLRDAYGNTYTYAQLGDVAQLYPVLEPRDHTAVSPRIAKPTSQPRPSGPASAGMQPHSPLSQAAVSASLALGAAAGIEAPTASTAPASPASPAPPKPAVTPRVFRAGPNEVYLHPLRPGVQVLAGTVLGHLGAAAAGGGLPGAPDPATGQLTPHMLFQIRPAGAGAPLIDPKPILDGWVRLEDTSIFRAKGENPFLATSPTVGQVLLESKPQLQQQVLHDPGIHFSSKCARGDVQADRVDRRVLAALEFLSVSGLRPTVSLSGCARAATASTGSTVEAVDITAIDGTPIAGHEQPGSSADIAVRRLLRLQGTMKPLRIVSPLSYPGAQNTLPGGRGLIQIGFQAPSANGARAGRSSIGRAFSSPLTPSQWLELVSRLGEIPDPTVAGKPSAAAIPDSSTAAGGSGFGSHPPAGG
jgi:soluble lytic murein transglycosylase-like protein